MLVCASSDSLNGVFLLVARLILRFENSNTGLTKDTKFYLESKASFIHISSIVSFKPFLITW